MVLITLFFVIVLIAICVNLVRELRHEPHTSTLDPQVRRAVIAHLHEDPHANGLPTTRHGAPMTADTDREAAGQQ